MYVRLRTSEASTFSDHVMRYRCVHCRLETTAHAYPTTAGYPARRADGRPGRHARAAIAAQVALSIRIAPCPRCHRHDRKAMLELYRATLWACFAILIAPVLVIAWSGQRWPAATLIGLALGAVPALVFWKHKTSRLASAQVRFDSLPP
jgi:hypothetical protein